MAEGKMEAEITKVEKQMEECRLNAKQYLQQGKKSIALKFLKKKKSLELVLKQREQAIDKICNLISIIQQTESNQQATILDAYSSGVQAFKGLREQTGLNESNIDDTMLDIQEAFETSEQINQTISQPIADTTDYNMDELEAELNDILTSTSAEDYLKDLENLPSVPSHEPGITPPKISTPVNQKRVAVKDAL
ncbi:hypothetical protein HELRODRAFT_164644 [Helobdella robusta]|uniref:Charged multivesicular body protein 6 n=1 Tax=Helobdella robusta TaxID=6412 RepID=T1EVN9_HELRO|nr:hypothetical protein HELRODRAFT_164644 [Helobdella robusta]ESN92572.1 hypothetical protein HELRODRAFT_164644 [Helobdella robusta]